MNIESWIKCGTFASRIINKLPAPMATKIYSIGHKHLTQQFIEHKPNYSFIPDINLERKLWNLTFRNSLINASGMFKNGDGYDMVRAQGAGGYIGGTSTYNPRPGNYQDKIRWPFILLNKSATSVNFMGLPNFGDEILAHKVITQNKHVKCPIGWSLARSPDHSLEDGLNYLIKSLWLYHDNPQIDFIEVNESCPNVKVSSGAIRDRLHFIHENFLIKRTRPLPVIIKFSNDLEIDAIPEILDILFEYKFDGITIGNASTKYKELLTRINPTEQALFKYFTNTFGGGVGGNLIKEYSLKLCDSAIKYKQKINPDFEFHVIRVGGINSIEDINKSNSIGVSLNQWLSGYMHNYGKYGNQLYSKIFE